MSKITEEIEKLARPVAEQYGCELWDVEYVKEAGTYYLRVFIDKEGGVGIDDCENISRALDPILDEEDPIADSYVFEVGSAGAERELKRPGDFEKFIGSEVDAKTYKAINGTKLFTGVLNSYGNGKIVINDVEFDMSDIAKVNLHVSF